MRVQKTVELHGVGTGHNPKSWKNLRPNYWLTTSEEKKEENRKRVSEWSKNFYADETKHPNWQGDNVRYRSLHRWVIKWLGKPEQCEHCPQKGTGHKMHWANKSGEYKRRLDDWIRLCPKCHKQYDKKNKT